MHFRREGVQGGAAWGAEQPVQRPWGERRLGIVASGMGVGVEHSEGGGQ